MGDFLFISKAKTFYEKDTAICGVPWGYHFFTLLAFFTPGAHTQ